MKDENKRTLYLKVRVSPEEMDAIKRKYKNSGMDSLSGFVRAMIFEGYIVQMDGNELRQIHKLASSIANNINQIARAASEDFMSFEVTLGEAFLSSIITRIDARYAPQLAMSGTDFEVLKYDDCILSCDPDRLAECLQNLIENAVKYGDGRRIKISFDKMDGCELITVSNTGCTLEAKELPQIFESFHRGSNSDKVQGNGLGLFICKRLMSLMGGEVYAEIRNGYFCVTLVVKLA